MSITTYNGRSIELTPSILAADFARLGEQVREAEAAGCTWLQADVMDGHFVPNLTFGPPVLKMLRPHMQGYFDMHLMVSNPDALLAEYVAAGANGVTVHWEACTHLHRTIQHIRELGCRPGVALNPATSVHVLDDILGDVDLVLLMSVNPGFGGQVFIERCLHKIRALRTMIDARGLDVAIQVDGGIKPSNARAIVEAGASNLVVGSAFYSSQHSAQEAWTAFAKVLAD